MRLIEHTSAPCLVCGKGNVPDRNGERQQFVDLERDVNWNDPAVLCTDCCLTIGALVGMESPERVRQMARQLKDLEKDIHKKDSDMDSMRRRARRLGMEFAESAS